MALKTSLILSDTNSSITMRWRMLAAAAEVVLAACREQGLT